MKGKAIVYKKDDIDTDMIIPAKYLNTDNPKELAEHAMEFLDSEFPKKVKEGDFLVAGRNFGCGSSREHAVWCLTGNGVQAVIAESFARIFFRNCINYGLLPVVLKDATKLISNDDKLEIDVKKGVVRNITKGKEHEIKPYPEFAMEIINAGGLMEYVKKEVQK